MAVKGSRNRSSIVPFCASLSPGYTVPSIEQSDSPKIEFEARDWSNIPAVRATTISYRRTSDGYFASDKRDRRTRLEKNEA